MISRPRLKANQILGDLGIDRPALLRHLKEICCVRGAFVREERLEGSEGRLVVFGDRGIITVRPSAYAGRARFSIAHELGHFELHRRLSGSFDCGPGDISANRPRKRTERDRRETEANQFASELLMPERFLLPEIFGRRPELALLKDLARDFGVSLTAACHRFAELTDESCAFVFERGGQLLHSWKSRTFALGRHWISPSGTGRGKPALEGLRPVEARDWLEPGPETSEIALYGQSESFRNLDLSITLLWIDPDESSGVAHWRCDPRAQGRLRPLAVASLEEPLSG